MEDAFKQLQEDNQNTVDNLIKWMKDSKLIDGIKVTEDKARQLFSEVTNSSNVDFAKFQEVIENLAKEHEMSVEEFSKTLAAQGQQLLDDVVAAASSAITAATNTFKDVMPK